jgi:6,7-dimethyl-8-ribityllumazine synthase
MMNLEPTAEVTEVVTSKSVKSKVQNKSIALVVSVFGSGNIGADVVKKAAVQTFYGNGSDAYTNNINIIEVENPFTLPYVVKKMMKKGTGDVILAVVVNIGAERDASLNQVLIPELVHIGMSGSIPVIPSVIQCDSLLELKAVISHYSESWSRSVDDISNDLVVVDINENSDALKKLQVEVAKTIDLTKDDLKVEDLITAFRATLKSHGALGKSSSLLIYAQKFMSL